MMNDTENGFRSQPHKGELHCSSLRQCISVTLSALLQPHPRRRCAFALHASAEAPFACWTNRVNRFCSGAVAMEVAWELITVRASLHGLACEQVNRSLLQKRHSTRLMQARCLSLNGPSFAAWHCHPRQDDENRYCSGQCALRYA